MVLRVSACFCAACYKWQVTGQAGSGQQGLLAISGFNYLMKTNRSRGVFKKHFLMSAWITTVECPCVPTWNLWWKIIWESLLVQPVSTLTIKQNKNLQPQCPPGTKLPIPKFELWQQHGQQRSGIIGISYTLLKGPKSTNIRDEDWGKKREGKKAHLGTKERSVMHPPALKTNLP